MSTHQKKIVKISQFSFDTISTSKENWEIFKTFCDLVRKPEHYHLKTKTNVAKTHIKTYVDTTYFPVNSNQTTHFPQLGTKIL